MTNLARIIPIKRADGTWTVIAQDDNHPMTRIAARLAFGIKCVRHPKPKKEPKQ